MENETLKSKTLIQTQNTISSFGTSWQDILIAAREQIYLRKGLIAKRVFLVHLPVAIVVAWWALLMYRSIGSIMENDAPLYFLYQATLAQPFFLMCATAAIVYWWIMNTVFQLEKIIWIDSFYGNRPLTPEQSWGIAKKMFWGVFLFNFYIFVRYLFLPIIIFFGSLAYLVYTAMRNGNQWNAVFLLLFTIGLMAFYQYFILVRLRFAMFLFLDQYGKNFSFMNFFAELKKLNTINETDAIKKTLLTSFGVDTADAVINIVVNSLSDKVEKVGEYAGFTGRVIGYLIDAYAAEILDIGRTAGIYILYRSARFVLYGKTQVVNDEVYGLVNQ